MDGVLFRSFTTRKIRSANIRVAESNLSKLSGDTDNTHIIVVAIYYSADRYPRAYMGWLDWRVSLPLWVVDCLGSEGAGDGLAGSL